MWDEVDTSHESLTFATSSQTIVLQLIHIELSYVSVFRSHQFVMASTFIEHTNYKRACR